jgi:hypothetical protein
MGADVSALRKPEVAVTAPTMRKAANPAATNTRAGYTGYMKNSISRCDIMLDMVLVKRLLAIQTLVLAGVGFLVGRIGIEVYADTSAGNALHLATVEKQTLSLAEAACVGQAQEDDVFFLSCGGIY